MTEREIFEAAIDIPAGPDRDAFIGEQCGDDDSLRARIARLLSAHDPEDSFLEHPAADALEATQISDEPAAEATGEEEFRRHLEPTEREGFIGRLAHYEIENILGRGAFGIVAKGFDTKLHRVVAIKMLAPELATTSPPRKRFLREARSSAAVTHESIVAIHAVEEQPVPYLVMEFVPGGTLADRLDENGPLDVRDIVRIGQQVASGLAAAHAVNLIHRDIKPSNIMLEDGPHGRAKITDFGLARAVDDATMTASGAIAGTPMYMSPEQARGETLDPRTDLFSLGSVLYQMTCGRPPFRAPSTIAVIRRVCDDTPRPLNDVISETPTWLTTIVDSLLDKDRDARYQSAAEVAQLLARCGNELDVQGYVSCVEPRAELVPTQAWSPPDEVSSGGRKSSKAGGVLVGLCALIALVAGVAYQTDLLSDFISKVREPKKIANQPPTEALEANNGETLQHDFGDPQTVVLKSKRDFALWLLENDCNFRVVFSDGTGDPGERISITNEADIPSESEILIVADIRIPPDFGDSRFAVLCAAASSLQPRRYGIGELFIPPDSITPDALKHLRGFALNHIHMDGCDVTPDGLRHLNGLRRVNHLDLNYSTVDDESIPAILGIPGLLGLSLDHTDLTDSGVRRLLRDPTGLIEVGLRGVPVTDGAFTGLGNQQQLAALRLSGTKVSETTLDAIVKLPNLSVLHVEYTPFNDQHLEQLPNKAAMRELLLGGTKVTKDGLLSLDRFPNLLWLSINDTPGAEQCLDQVMSLKKLGVLFLGGNDFTREQILPLTTLDLEHLYVLGNAKLSKEDVLEIAKRLPGGKVSSDYGTIEIPEASVPTAGELPPSNRDPMTSAPSKSATEASPPTQFSSLHELAKWLVQRRCRILLIVAGESSAPKLYQPATTIDDLPPARRLLAILEVEVPAGFGDANFASLCQGIKSLQPNGPPLGKLALAPNSVSNQALKHVAGIAFAHLAFSGFALDDIGASYLSEVAHAQFLECNSSLITDAAIEAISRIPRLVQVRFGDTQLTDAGVDQLISSNANLRLLSVQQLPLTDAAFTSLDLLDELEGLRITDTLVSIDTLKAVTRLPKLQELDAKSTPVNDAIIAALPNKSSFSRLIVMDTDVTDKGLMMLSEFPNLTYLAINATPNATACFPAITKMTRLTHLRMPNVECTAEDLRAFSSLPLAFFDIRGIANLSKADVLGIANRHKGCEVVSDFGAIRIPEDTESPATADPDGETPATLETPGFEFDKVGSGIPVGDIDLDLTEPFTIELWCQPVPILEAQTTSRCAIELGPVSVVIYDRSSAPPRWEVLTENRVDGPLSSGTYSVYEAAAFDVPLRRQHIAAQWDGEQFQLFADGREQDYQLTTKKERVASDQPLFREILAASTSRWLKIGESRLRPVSGHAARTHFDGHIDQVRISRGQRYKGRFEPADLIADNATVVLYRLDTAAGGKVIDLSGNGYDAFQSRDAEASRPIARPESRFRPGLLFHGGTDRVELPITLEPGEPFTIEAIFVPSAVPPDRTVRFIDAPSGFSFYQRRSLFRADAGSKSVDSWGDNGEGYYGVENDRRTMVALVSDGRELRFFLNGVPLWSLPDARMEPLTEITLGKAGRQLIADDMSFAGLLKQVRVTQSARYSEQFKVPDVLAADADSHAVYWFDGDDEETAIDRSGNGRDAAILGPSRIKRIVAIEPTPAAIIEWVRTNGGVARFLDRDGRERSSRQAFQMSNGISSIHMIRLAEGTDEESVILLANALAEVVTEPMTLSLRGAGITNRSLDAIAATPLKHLSLIETRATAEGLRHVSRMRQLEELVLDRTKIGRSSVVPLRDHPTLRRLSLAVTSINDSTVASLLQNTRWESLNLDQNDITDASAQHLSRAEGLVELRLAGTKFTNDGVASLSALRSLRGIDLGATQVDGDVIDVIPNRANIRWLSIGYQNLSEESLLRVSTLPKLEYLALPAEHITRDVMLEIAKLSRLQTLSLGRSPISFEDLLLLEPCDKLIFLRANVHQVTERQRQQLQELMPNCNIGIRVGQ